MTLPDVCLLASARAAFPLWARLETIGVHSLHTWVVPDGCSAETAADRAAEAMVWEGPLSDGGIVITAFDSAKLLQSVVLPHVVPYLTQDTAWLQMGAVAATDRPFVEAAVTFTGVCLIQAPLRWTPEGQLPSAGTDAPGTEPADHDLEPAAALAYALSLIAPLRPNFGLTPPQPMDADTAYALAQMELEFPVPDADFSRGPDVPPDATRDSRADRKGLQRRRSKRTPPD
ncbi:hypothetical protein [Streptomyces sp. NPDC050704]|uniref:hypothetical protein n=1 Tax=Streptomyces sp. NPDC050704 TaxID=3157219 RepID=UPI00342C829D